MEERQDRAEKMNRWRMMRHHPRSLASSLLVSASVALSGCSGDFAGAQTGIPSDAAAVQLHVLASGSNSTMSTRERLVVRDAATLETVWPRIVGNVLPAPPVPVVDFGANVVIVASWTLNNARLLMLSKLGEAYDPKTGEACEDYVYQVLKAYIGTLKR